MINVETPHFRKATAEEAIIVREAFNQFLDESSSNPLDEYQLWIREDRITEVYGVMNKTDEILKNINVPIYSSGIPLGRISQDEFHLEIEGAALIIPSTEKIVGIKTEQFLYGKPIYGENIIKTSYKFEKGELVIITGKNNLHYGLGIALISSKDLAKSKPNTIVVKGYKNLPMDRGWYLRKGN